MKHIALTGIIMAGTLALTACGSSSSSESLIDPASQPEELAQGLSVKVGGANGVSRSSKDAPIPAPSDDPAAPTVQSAPTNDLNVANGDTAKADIVFNSAANLSGLFAKVVGADSYVEFALEGGSAKASRDISLDITVPANTRDGRFCIDVIARDADGLVSESARICYQIRSDRDDENSSDQVRSQLQGNWQGICDGAGSSSSRSVVTINGNNFSDTTQFFDNASCSGTPVSEDTDTGTFVLGAELTTASGVKAREFDVFDDGGDAFLDIVRVQGDQFLLGINAEGRPEQLNFDSPYTRASSSPTQDNTPLGDQTWIFSTSIKGTVSGQNVDQTLTDFEVSGLDVPQDSSAGEQEALNLSEGYAQALEQGCDGGFEENQPTRIDNFNFMQSGNGEVGSIFEGQIDLLIDGVCRSSDGDTTIDVDVMYMYRAERTS